MALILGKLKCCFCNKKNGLLQSVHEYGIYADDIGKRIFYHLECLKMVEVSPEKFGHILMDMAIHINDLQKENIEKCNSKLVEEFEKKVQTLNGNHFKRMIPKRGK